MATCGSKNGLTSLLEHRGGKTMDTELQKPSHNDGYIVYCGNLEDCGNRILTTLEHQVQSSCLFDNETASK